MRATRLPGIPARDPMQLIYHYVHPMDNCPNGGAEWRVVFEEIAPGLFDIRHPRCSYCLAEPPIVKHEHEIGTRPWIAKVVDWPEVKRKTPEEGER